MFVLIISSGIIGSGCEEAILAMYDSFQLSPITLRKPSLMQYTLQLIQCPQSSHLANQFYHL
jgi:hypothetical protein